jgi:hypothetical protein
MSEKIQPKYVDGEPVCSASCPRYGETPHKCGSGDVALWDGDPCIPALRRDRDKHKAENERLKAELSKSQKEWHHWKATTASKELKEHFMELESELSASKEENERLRKELNKAKKQCPLCMAAEFVEEGGPDPEPLL